jgi:O-antigen ligase
MKSIDRIIWGLFYLYVMMLPFENFMGHIWQIDTPYRPHRVLCLFIGILILLSRSFSSIRFHSNDLKLAGVYLFGLIPSVIAYLNSRFNAEYFWSTSLQYFVVIWILLLIKNVPVDLKHIRNCLLIYCFGTLANSLYMIYQFLYTYPGRHAGMMDGPNAAAFACDISLAFFFYYLVRVKDSWLGFKKLGTLLACILLIIALQIAGSRGSMLVTAGVILFILYYRVSFHAVLKHSLILAGVLFLVFKSFYGEQFLNLMPAYNRLTLLDRKSDARSALWVHGFEAFKESRFVGLGIEQVKNPEIYDKYIKVADNRTVNAQKGLVLHNDYLTVLYEFGLIPFILFLSFYFSLLKRLIHKCRLNDGFNMYLGIFIVSAGFPLFTPGFQLHTFWFCFIILSCVAYLELKNNHLVNHQLNTDHHEIPPKLI